MVSVPNFNHWYPRGRIVAGRFDYDQRGPLDRGHVRFFTKRSIERLFEAERPAGPRAPGLHRPAPRRRSIGAPTTAPAPRPPGFLS